MRKILLTVMGAWALSGAMPAAADVKAGVDAWSHGDYKTAVDQWRGPAVAGDADAQFNLGQAYKLGRGVPIDPVQAEDWFRRAALQGRPLAEDNYGLALFEAHKFADAVPWLEKSVARGEPRAQVVFGTMLFNGDGVIPDYVRAYALMTRASAQGLAAASETLAQMDQYISPADRQKGTVLAQQYAAQETAIPRPGADIVVSAGPAAKSAVPSKRQPPVRPEPSRGGWRVQLGAFHDRANAEALWAKVRGHMAGAQPFYVTVGLVTRLMAGGFASRADAQHACAAAGTACVVVAP